LIHYAYNTQLQPPAPFVLVTLRAPVTGAESRDVPAQLDSAADRTVLPLAFAQGLALHVCGQVTVVGFGGPPTQTPLYSVELGVHTKTPAPVRVIASPTEAWVLLGRDVVNAHRFVLDGPALGLDFD
jgi:hypothetical protein